MHKQTKALKHFRTYYYSKLKVLSSLTIQTTFRNRHLQFPIFSSFKILFKLKKET